MMKIHFKAILFILALLLTGNCCLAADLQKSAAAAGRPVMGKPVTDDDKTLPGASHKLTQDYEKDNHQYVKRRLRELEKALESKTRSEVIAEQRKKIKSKKIGEKFYHEKDFEKTQDFGEVLKPEEIEEEVAKRLKTESKLQNFGMDFFERGELVQSNIMAGSAPPNYQLGPGDELKIIVWSELGDETVYDVQVNPGVMGVSGLTVGELEQMVLGSLANKFKHFKGQVTLTKVRTIQVFIVGEVEKPGALTVSGLTTAFSALYQAGGPTDRGSMRRIKVLGANGKSSELDLYLYFLTGDRSQDVSLKSGDTVFVPAISNSVTVKGMVTRPAIYEINKGDSLAKALAMAGNALPEAYSGRVKINRWTGNQRRRTFDVSLGSLEDLKSFILANGDEITVEKAIATVGNKVSIEGAVKKPGDFAINNGATVVELIKKAGGLIEEEANSRYGQIIRKGSAGIEEIILFNLRAALLGDNDENIRLQPFDQVVIFAQSEITPDVRFVNIDGAVRRPGEYIYRNGMTLSDLLLKARGLSVDAAEVAEIARVEGDGSKIHKVNVKIALGNPKSSENMVLRPLDRVSILSHGDRLVESEVVMIKGQVRRPGPYALKHRGEKLSSLIERAGGLTKNAFADGAVFMRKIEHIASAKQLATAKEVQDEMFRQASLDLRADLLRSGARLDTIKEVRSEVEGGSNISEQVFNETLPDESGSKVTSSSEEEKSGFSKDSIAMYSRSVQNKTVRIPVPVKDIVEGKAEDFEDIALLNGDQITIPVIPTTVSVLGAVVNPTTILFSRNRNAGYYVNRAGGYTRSSNHRRTVIVRANGEVLPMRQVRRIERGDIILVPPKANLVRPDKLKEWGNIASILGNLAVTYKVVDDKN
jgi:protein involved in polysaccharide export with SLBB domain